MKNIKTLITAIILGIFCGCSSDEVPPKEMIVNGNLENGATMPTGWEFSTGENNYSVLWTNETSFSPEKSLKISTEIINEEHFAFWSQLINTDIPVGEDVTLEVKVKGTLEGKGASIAIRGDTTSTEEGKAEQFVSTQGNTLISGDFDWTTYNVVMKGVYSDIQSLTIYLIFLPNTRGEVFFDDISVSH